MQRLQFSFNSSCTTTHDSAEQHMRACARAVLAALLPLLLSMLCEPCPPLSGAIYPANGPLAKANGRAVACFGPVTSWSMEYAADGPAVVVNTHKASYVLAKPSGSYKKVFAGVEEQANLMYEVLQVGAV